MSDRVGDAPASTPASTEPITTPTGREVVPGGWRRAVTGVVVGVAAGLVHALARAADEADRARSPRARGGGR